VEVLPESSIFIDRHTKFYAYQEKNIPYYVIISPKTEETEICVLENGAYQLKQKAIAFQHVFHFKHDCEAAIDFAEGNKKAISFPGQRLIANRLKAFSPPQHPGKHQWRHNRGIAFNNVFWCVNVQLAPGDFFIGMRTGIRTIRSC
jgi:hypothetical protein